MRENRSEIFVKCECGGEGMFMQHDDGLYYVSILASNEQSLKMNWFTRLKIILKILLSGKIYHDQVVLSKQSANELIDYFCTTGTPLETVDTYTIDELHIQNGSTSTQ